MKIEKRRAPIGRRPKNEGRKTFWALAAAAAVLGVFGVAHTWTRVAVLERKYQLSHAQVEHERLTNELEKLQLEAETYESQTRIELAARSPLNMAKPAPTNVIVVERTVAPRAAPRSVLAENEH